MKLTRVHDNAIAQVRCASHNNIKIYYMAGSASGQDEANPVF